MEFGAFMVFEDHVGVAALIGFRDDGGERAETGQGVDVRYAGRYEALRTLLRKSPALSDAAGCCDRRRGRGSARG